MGFDIERARADGVPEKVIRNHLIRKGNTPVEIDSIMTSGTPGPAFAQPESISRTVTKPYVKEGQGGLMGEIYKSLYPTANEADQAGRSFPRRIAAGMSDISTLPARSGFALKEAISSPEGERLEAYKRKVQDTTPEGLLEEMLIDPTLLPLMMTPMGTAAKGAAFVPKLVKALKTGAKMAAVTAPIKMAESYGRGNTPGEVIKKGAIEGLTSAAIPPIMTTTGAGLKKVGVKGMKTFLSPQTKKVFGRRSAPAADDISRVALEKASSIRPFSSGSYKMNKRVEKLTKQVLDNFDDTVKSHLKTSKHVSAKFKKQGRTITEKMKYDKVSPADSEYKFDALKALKNSYNEITKFHEGGTVSDKKIIKKQMDEWLNNIISTFKSDTRKLNLSQTVNLVRDISKKTFVPESKRTGGELASFKLWEELRPQLERVPTLKDKYKALSDLIPLQRVLERKEKKSVGEALKKVFPYLSLGGIVAGGTGYGTQDPVKAAITGLAAPLVLKSIVSPQAATAAWRTGKALQTPIASKIVRGMVPNVESESKTITPADLSNLSNLPESVKEKAISDLLKKTKFPPKD